LRAQNAESLYAILRSEIAYNITIQPLARSAGERAGGVRADNADRMLICE